MGNDLLLNTVWWDRNNPPRWDDARTFIENLSQEQLQNHPEFEFISMYVSEEEALSTLKSRLLRCHDDIRASIDAGGDRHTYVLTIGKYDVLVSGGDSWGDSPSEMFDTIQDWGNIEGLPEFGFYPDYKGV